MRGCLSCSGITINCPKSVIEFYSANFAIINLLSISLRWIELGYYLGAFLSNRHIIIRDEVNICNKGGRKRDRVTNLVTSNESKTINQSTSW